MIERLFSAGVATAESWGDAPSEPLRPEEAAGLGRAVEKRVREFSIGRACARRAFARLGLHDVTLPSGTDRLPLWPAGIVGSITHCEGYCGVAVARRGEILGLGLDADQAIALDESLVPLVCLPSEVAATGALPGFDPGEAAKLVFSAKESAYKCYFPLVHHILEFHDVEVAFTIDAPRAGSFVARVLRGPSSPFSEFHGRFVCDDVHVFTGVTLRARR